MAVEDLLASERRSSPAAPADERQLWRHDLVVEGIALAAEATPVRNRPPPGCGGGWNLQHLGQRTLHVVWCLGRRIESQTVVVLEGPPPRRAAPSADGCCPGRRARSLEDHGRPHRILSASTSPNSRLDTALWMLPRPLGMVVNDAVPRSRGQRLLRRCRWSPASWYSTSTASAAARASRRPRSTATTAATGSPTKRTLSGHSACSSWDTGRMP